MTFKKVILADLQTFLNITENAEWIELNGKKIKAVISYESGKISKNGASSQHGLKPENHGQNFIGETITVYYDTILLAKTPVHSEFVIMNGRKYKVESSADQQGITKLVLMAERMQTPRLPIYQ